MQRLPLRLRPVTVLLAGLALACAGTASATALPAATGSPAAAAALPLGGAGGAARFSAVGAHLPFREYQAEDARTTGTVIGPDRAYGTLAAEAIGRKAVRLDAAGRYVEFRLARAANAVDVRYSVPDSPNGAGLDGELAVQVNGVHASSLAVTSRYSWYYGQYPWSNDPADGGRRQLYDDSRLMFGKTLPAGTRVRLTLADTAKLAWAVVDLADFEQVAPPGRQPAGSLSVLDFGADPTGAIDSSDAIQRAIDAASLQRRTLWLPRGTFTVTRHLIVDRVTIRGAGPWYSVLRGSGVGVYGNYAPHASSHVRLSDFAIMGETTERVDADQVNGIGGSLAHSSVDDIWIQHTKVGAWLDGPFDGLRLSRLRILDQTADGVNFHDGITNSSVTDSFVRNTGDDGLAMWSEHHPDTGDVFARNTVQIPTLANNFAVYGGSDNRVIGNLATDSLTQGGGIHVGNRFGAVPLAGDTKITGNVLVRTGSIDLATHIGEGAMWFYAADEPMSGVVDVDHNVIYDSSYEAVQFVGSTITNVRFDHDLIVKTGTFAVQLNAPGAATFNHVFATQLGAGGRYDCSSGFTITARDSYGWSDTHCGYPAPGALTISAQNLQFVTDGIGSPSEPQTVTVTNPTSRSAHIESISTTGTYSISTDCPTSLPAHASCAVRIVFLPTAHGDRTGALTISDGTPAGRYQVYLQGKVVQSTVGNLAAGKSVTASSEIGGFPAANTTDSNTDTYWESAANAFPQTLTVDLGGVQTVSRVALKLNSGWGGRTERFAVSGSSDGVHFSTLSPASDYALDPGTNNNTADVTFAAAQERYVRVEVTGNTGWPAAQVAEFEVYAS